MFENIQGNQYSQAFSQNLDVSISNPFGPFLYPNQYVNFNSASAAVQKGAELSAGVTDQLGVVSAVYNYVVKNLTYDTAKASSVQSGYLPNVDLVLAQKKGICFDYAALMTAMLRSQDIPTKLVVGYTGNLYHAWINVYLEGQAGWTISFILTEPAGIDGSDLCILRQPEPGDYAVYRKRSQLPGEIQLLVRRTEKMEKQGEKYDRYSYEELSAFCLQIALLLEAAVPLEEGLTIMAEDAAEEKEKAMLLYMAEGAELGDPFFKVLEDTGVFPPYIVRMARLGQQTGTLDQMMKSLSDYYEKEARLLKAVKNAATYPAMMILMLLVVLFVLFTKVMPVFSRVYEQLGASLPPAAAAAIRLGGILSGAALVLAAVTGAAAAVIWIAARFGKRFSLVEKGVAAVKNRSRIARAVALRRFTSVLALTLKSGLELEKSMELAKELAENETVAGQIDDCSRRLEEGESYYDA